MVKKALETLTDDPNREKSVFTRFYPTVGTALFFFAGTCFVNAGTRRPILSGIQKHIAAAIAGGFIGNTIDGWRDDHVAERDANLRYYVETHPDDFPDPIRKTYGELLLPWVPIR